MAGILTSKLTRLLAGALMSALASTGAFAQANNLFAPGAGSSLLAPDSNAASRQNPLLMPAPAAPNQQMTMVPAGRVALELGARFGKDAPPITSGLTWRVYSGRQDSAGNYPLVREEKVGSPTIVLPPGPYIVHVGFGLANATKPVTLRSETVREVFELPAGGLRLEGRVGDVKIPGRTDFVRYLPGQSVRAGRPAPDRRAGHDRRRRRGAGGHLLHRVGLRQRQLDRALRHSRPSRQAHRHQVTHRAAVVTLKLVSGRGGEALANTAWSVLTPGGDVIKESIGAFPRVVLAEGDYRAIARNDGRVYERGFKVITGVDGDVEVLAR